MSSKSPIVAIPQHVVDSATATAWFSVAVFDPVLTDETVVEAGIFDCASVIV